MSEQLYIQSHNRVCGVIHRHICKNLNIPVPENSWKHEPKAIIEYKDITLTYNLMIPLGMNIENKALRPDMELRYKKENKGTYAAISVTEDTGQNSQLYNSAMSPHCNKVLFIEVLILSDFGLNTQKIRK